MGEIFTLRKNTKTKSEKNQGVDIVIFNGEKILQECAKTHDFMGADFLWVREKVLTLLPFLSKNLEANSEDKFALYDPHTHSSFKMEFSAHTPHSWKFRMKYRHRPGTQSLYEQEPFCLHYKNHTQWANNINYIQKFNTPFYRFLSSQQEYSISLIPQRGTSRFELNNFYLSFREFFQNILEEEIEGILREFLAKEYEIQEESNLEYLCLCTKENVIQWVKNHNPQLPLLIENNTEKTSCLKVHCEYCFHDYFLFKEDIDCFAWNE